MSPGDWWAMLSAEEGTFHEVRFRWTDPQDRFKDWPRPGSEWVRLWVGVEERARFERTVTDPDEDCSLSLVPRQAPLPDGMQPAEWVGKSNVVWARLDSKAQLQKLRHFRPVPTVVIRHGASVHRTAIWWLSTPLNVVQVERANRRLAHALGSKKKWADPLHSVMVPGTVLRHSAPGKPCAVHVEWETEERSTLGAVVGRLKDAPEPWHPDRVAA